MKKFNLISATAMSLLFVGCGAKVEEIGTVPVASSSNSPIYAFPTPTPTDGGGSNNDGGLLDPLSFSFEMSGSGGTSQSFSTPTDGQGNDIQTDTILEVLVKAGPATRLKLEGQYSNFSAEYSCVSYKVTALGQSVVTEPLATDVTVGCDPDGPYGPRPRTYQTSQKINFSQRLTPGRTTPVKITLSDARYDFYCRLYYSGYGPLMGQSELVYCPLRTVYKNHGVSGILKVRTNGMRSL